MPVVKEFYCRGHGPFESSDQNPKCPRGNCNGIERAFRTAPSVRTNGRTKGIDDTLTKLAADFHLTDLSTRNGSVMNSIRPHSKPDHVARSYENLYAPFNQPGAPNPLQPRYASAAEVTGMLDNSKRPFRGLNGIGDQLHARMGSRNIDPALTVIEAETTKDDNVKFQHVIDSGGTV